MLRLVVILIGKNLVNIGAISLRRILIILVILVCAEILSFFLYKHDANVENVERLLEQNADIYKRVGEVVSLSMWKKTSVEGYVAANGEIHHPYVDYQYKVIGKNSSAIVNIRVLFVDGNLKDVSIIDIE